MVGAPYAFFNETEVRMRIRAILSALCLVFAAPCAAAYAGPIVDETGPNLIANGGFESSSTIGGSSWTTSGFVSEGFDNFIDIASVDAHSGSQSFAGGGIGALAYISQTIATIAGQDYNIHLWLGNFWGFASGTEIQVLWDGAVVYSASNIPGASYSEIVIDPMATSSSTVFSIALRDNSAFLNVDDVVVRAVSATSTPVPEPFTLSIFGAGIAGAVAMRRRKAKFRVADMPSRIA